VKPPNSDYRVMENQCFPSAGISFINRYSFLWAKKNLGRLFFAFTLNKPFADSHSGMDTDCRGSYAENGFANLISTVDDSGGGDFHIWQSLVERSHGIPEIGFGTAKATMTDTYRPDIDVVEANSRAVGEGFWALAANFIQTVTELVTLISKVFDETAFVEMGASLTMVVDSSAISKERTVQLVKGRQSLKGQVMENGTEEVDRVRWASGDIDDRFAAY
jgi:hypothetical protein